MSDLKLDNLTIEQVRSELNKVQLKNKDDYYFIINDDINIISKRNGTITNFFLEYMKEFIDKTDGRIYEYYGIEEEAYAKKVLLQNCEEVYVGFKYSTTSRDIAMPFVLVALLSTFIYIIILVLWSKHISNNISNVSEQLTNIAKDSDVEQEKVIPIYSRDEIGELSNAYNKIQSLTNKHIRKLKEDEEKIIEQTELNTLGELAGGIAHDLNSPLMAIRTNMNTLGMYMNSEKIKADEETKNKITNILKNIDKSFEGMSKIINSIRKQTQSSGTTEKEQINLLELIEQIRTLQGSRFRNNNCGLIVDINKNIKIYGERHKLDRILTNIITNSLDAYKANKIKGDILIELSEDEEYYIICLSDKAGGIPKDVQSKLLKEQITTKGKDGTGIGIKNSNNLLVTAFNGKMTFESKENVGTTFYIKIPKDIVVEE